VSTVEVYTVAYLLDCPASEALRHAIFGTTFDWSKPWGLDRLWVWSPRPRPSERVG